MLQLPVPTSHLMIHSLRLGPGKDLKADLEKFAKEYAVEAGFVLTCVGSLTHAEIRLANQEQGQTYRGFFEIVSLVGTLSINGSHIHISVSDSSGYTTGGHLLEGCKVYTTAELVLGVLPEVVYKREPDSQSGHNELTIYPKKP
ncbi:PPC domain-containing DNA-binding protein [Salmonirosea aquatica]|uniref:DUF296 domain-containing protein n=1 Tax=Salmonirosea aquatica TaxID=2654236 RepID=A0A7C9F5Q3_9BACT|nr:DUF296 domain-containing protein [Cytophagaceae bacterium SJW1-29]